MRRLVRRVAKQPGVGLLRNNIPGPSYDGKTLKPIFGKRRVRTLMKLPNDGQGDPDANIVTTHGVKAGASSEGASTAVRSRTTAPNSGKSVIKPPNPAGKGGRIGRRLRQGQ